MYATGAFDITGGAASSIKTNNANITVDGGSADILISAGDVKITGTTTTLTGTTFDVDSSGTASISGATVALTSNGAIGLNAADVNITVSDDFVVDAADATGNTWYAAGVGGGLWKGIYDPITTNVSWTNMTPLTIQNLAIVTLGQSASNPIIIYAGTGESALGASTAIDGDGIFKIDVSGPDPVWTNISPQVGGLIDHRFGSVNRLIVDPSNSDIVIANTFSFSQNESYIFKSIDGGSSWNKVHEEGTGIILSLIHI